ncbi:uncharacterized protein LOC114849673 isoform X2 [Betta splendens]|uniref:Uncharacterized protein LOC114849673 isoform X2 n=1 Tax=Betta splendens TaxID=158456 RepID=A0A6P7LT86_BETSP|nr:uncharacterized protein LOC114849673 isoform X2 [Betta splendens]
MDEFQHPLFFEATDLTDRDKDRIRRYFMANWESGGGECGMIEMTEDNTCKICFKKIEVQENVLRRTIHTISLPSGDLQLTVSRTSSPQTPNWRTAEIISKTNINNLRMIFKIDIYLMYYLRDNPKAYKPLEKQLSAIGCSVELDFNQEEAVVRGDIEKGPGRGFGAAEKWEIQVDRVFSGNSNNYIRHNVLDPKQIRVLEQDPSFNSDNIRVYRETGCYIIVGDAGAVKDMVANLEKRVPIQKNIPVVKKKFEMVKEEFVKVIHATYPEVKILIVNSMIILEGLSKEVQSGATQLDELMKQVKEKRLNLPTELLTFIRSSGVISKIQARFLQCLMSSVSLEVVSDLVLFSLSSDALDEAEAAIIRDLIVDTVELQGAAAVPPDVDRVKEILTKAKNRANCRELRVESIFSPGTSRTAVTKVQLIGYRENVNKLKEILHDYQMNHVRTQEMMDLSPDLVDCFDKVLGLLEVKQTEVTLKASKTPHAHVLVSGPHCRVQEAQRNLRTSLASLKSDTLVLDGSGAQRFFQAEGRTNMELVETACKVIIREGKCVLSPNVTRRPRSTSSSRTISCRSLQMPRTKVEIKLGSLEDQKVNVLVVPMLNKNLTSTKIGKCLCSKAGDMIKFDFILAAAYHTLQPGDVMQVDAPPSLGCSKIFFIECLPWDGVRGQSEQALASGLKRCLDLCVQQGCSSVAVPVIGPGLVLKYPLREAVEVLTETIRQFQLSASSGSLSTIHVVIKPGYANAEECYNDVDNLLGLNMTQRGQDLSVLFTSSTNQQSVFHFLGFTTQNVDTAMTKLKDLYQAQCSRQTLTQEQLEGLTQDDIEDLKQLVETQGLYMQRDQSGQGILTVSGSNDGVSQVMQMVNGFQKNSLIREIRIRDEDELYPRVAWCILGHNGNWERLPKTANYDLENNDASGEIMDARGNSWSVNLQVLEATRRQTGQKTNLKRLENCPDFILPLYWDNMRTTETMKVVVLHPFSAEYQTVKKAFVRTVTKSIIKIERVQNFHQRRAYEALKKQMSDKTKLENGGEKLLYHGTSQDKRNSIMKTGFNRSFAGQNGNKQLHMVMEPTLL